MTCPKCGHTPEWFEIKWGAPSTRWLLGCSHCCRVGPSCGTKKAALKAWNSPQNFIEFINVVFKKCEDIQKIILSQWTKDVQK